MATGLLIVGINAGTKLLQYVSGASKTYLATMRFGAATTTDDAEGEVTATAGCESLLTADFEAVEPSFRGEILQVPTAVSAIKIDGKRAYARVRAGEEVELPARPVTVHRLVLLGPPRATTMEVDGRGVPVVDVDVEVECSSGTYIRALARDLGRELGTGGHLTALRRTSIGRWSVAEADPLAELEAEVGPGGALPVIGLARASSMLFPTAVLTAQAAARLRHGQAPADTDVAEVREAEQDTRRSACKVAGIHAAQSVQSPGAVLGLIRKDDGGRLGWKTVSVFAPDVA